MEGHAMDDEKRNALLTQREVMKLTGFRSRTSLYRRSKGGTFPKPVKLGLGQIRWREADINDWMSSLPLRDF
jgi:prophage regulatory protein